MNPRPAFLALPLLVLAAATVQAADPAGFGQDLKAAIALQGLPCDQVVSSTRNSDSNYNAVCKDGNRYHVFVDGNGRVVVKKL